MAILRLWSAAIRRELRDEYVGYVTATGIAAYRATPRNLGASIAVRDLDGERSEIVTLSWWDSIGSIRAFAGDAYERARYFPHDDRFLVTRPDHAVHYETPDSLLPATVRSETGGTT